MRVDLTLTAKTHSDSQSKGRVSAGLLMFRRRPALQVFLVHPGGPFWRNKDLGAWSIPKGEVLPGEDALAAARREFQEETGITAGEHVIPLGHIQQKAGKLVHAWAFERETAPPIRSNTFTVEWPPKSGRMQEFPEVDRAEWLAIPDARARINPGQIPFLDRLLESLIGK